VNLGHLGEYRLRKDMSGQVRTCSLMLGMLGDFRIF
jgi:hypothetical protein